VVEWVAEAECSVVRPRIVATI